MKSIVREKVKCYSCSTSVEMILCMRIKRERHTHWICGACYALAYLLVVWAVGPAPNGRT